MEHSLKYKTSLLKQTKKEKRDCQLFSEEEKKDFANIHVQIRNKCRVLIKDFKSSLFMKANAKLRK